jgi:hypothetical protein
MRRKDDGNGRKSHESFAFFWVMGVLDGGHDHDYLYLGEEEDDNNNVFVK